MKKQPRHRRVPCTFVARYRDRILHDAVLDSLAEYAVYAVSTDGRIISWSSAAAKTFGYTRAEITDLSFEATFTAEDIAQGVPWAQVAGVARGDRSQHDRWHVRQDGSRFWGLDTVAPLYDRAGALVGFSIAVRPAAEQASRSSEHEFRRLIDSVSDFAIISVEPKGAIRTWSAGAQTLFGYTAQHMIGASIFDIMEAFDPATRSLLGPLPLPARTASAEVEQWFVRSDGSRFYGSGKLCALRNDADVYCGFVAILYDATQRIAVETDMRRRAHYDGLTDLPNRRMFYEHVERAISLMRRRASDRFAVLFVDIDYFKEVNAEFGHVVADQLLAAIARRLEKCIRSGDMVARLGGDEFAILLNGLAGVADADDVAHRILLEMREAVPVESREINATLSLGIAIGDATHVRPEEVLRDADAALYAAKAAGRARAAMFDEAIGDSARAHVELKSTLRLAIEHDELQALFQPVLRLRDMCTVGFEALVRWRHPHRGLLLPGDFLPHAEASKFIVSIDRWMLQQACVQLARWRAESVTTEPLHISVNISSRQMERAEFVDDIARALAASGTCGASLRLEVSEALARGQMERATPFFASIRSLGVRLDVDDFGTGFASLGALNRVVVDGLKVDWSSMTRRDGHDGWELVESVISLAHKLGLVAIAEGIENSDQLRRLINLGCDFGQGHLFAPPLDAHASTAFLTAAAHQRMPAWTV